MPVFQYEALTEKGTVTRGTVDADTAKEARANLRAKRVHVVRMEKLARTGRRRAEAAGEGFRFKLPELRKARGAADVPMTTRQLATLLKAGIPLADAVNALVQQVESAELERVLRSAAKRNRIGSTASIASRAAVHTASSSGQRARAGSASSQARAAARTGAVWAARVAALMPSQAVT